MNNCTFQHAHNGLDYIVKSRDTGKQSTLCEKAISEIGFKSDHYLFARYRP